MILPPTQSPQEPKTSRTQKLKSALLPLGLISFGILNGTARSPVLVIVGVVSGILVFTQPYLGSKRSHRKVKSAFLVMLGALVFAFPSLIAKPAQAQFFQNAETFFNTRLPHRGRRFRLSSIHYERFISSIWQSPTRLAQQSVIMAINHASSLSSRTDTQFTNLNLANISRSLVEQSHDRVRSFTLA